MPAPTHGGRLFDPLAKQRLSEKLATAQCIGVREWNLANAVLARSYLLKQHHLIAPDFGSGAGSIRIKEGTRFSPFLSRQVIEISNIF
jgi:hypothetical protein